MGGKCGKWVGDMWELSRDSVSVKPKIAAIMVGPYLRGKQHKRPNAKVKFRRIRSDWVSPRRCGVATVPPVR